MRPRDDQLRAAWQALCADPARDDLAAALAAELHRRLDDALAAVPLASTDHARADAIGDALFAVLCLQRTRERRPFVPGPYALDLRARLAGDELPDDDDDDDPVDLPEPEPDPAEPFLAWKLGDRARDAPELERDRWLDAAIAAFDAIALRPIDPGNDLGPFTRIADLMSEPQVRRSIAVTERMVGWGDMEHAYARAYLYSRLAGLGALDEAESLLPRIADPSIRAFARGRVFGHRVAHGRDWTLPAGDELPGEHLYAFVSGLGQVLPDPPDALVFGCLDLARAHPDPHFRGVVLETLAADWSAVGPLAAWRPVVREHPDAARRIAVMLELAAAQLGDPDAPALVDAALAQLSAGADPGPWIDELVAVRVHVRDPVPLFVGWMTHAAGRRSWLLRDLHDTRALEDFLRWLAGDAALAAAVRALDDLTALLAVPSDT